MAEGARISVVIPTTGRHTLAAAVESALRQTYPPVEVIVVFDAARIPDGVELPPGVRALVTGSPQGANVARQHGIEAASGDAIALLDDDDYWFEGKLEAQASLLEAARRSGRRAVVSAGVQLIDQDGSPLDVVPRRLIAEHQTVADYLFKRQSVRAGEATMGSSTLLIERALALEVPFEPHLLVHEDWDWLLRAARDGGASFLMAPGPQLAYRYPSPRRGLSRSSKWPQSVTWVNRYRGYLTPREYGDLLLTVSVVLAVDSGARLDGLRIAFTALRNGRPGPAAVIVALGVLLLPRAMPHRFVRIRARLLGVSSRRKPEPMR